jgi:chitodextrinase
LALAGCGPAASGEALGSPGTTALGDLPAAVSASADVTPPSTPSDLTWYASDMTVVLSWGASTDDVGVAGYQLYYGAFFLGTFTDRSLSLIGFKAGTPYNFTVKAIDAAGNLSQASNQTTVLLQAGPDTTPPTAPSNLSTTFLTNTRVELRWSPSSDNMGVVAYQVYVDSSLASTVSLAVHATVSGLTPGTTYHFTVRALDAAGNISPDSNIDTTTTVSSTDTTPPSVPTGLTATNVTSTSLLLSWVASADDDAVTMYDVMLDMADDPTGKMRRKIDTTGTSVTAGLLTPSTTYNFTIFAHDRTGNISAGSAPLVVTTLGGGGGYSGGGGGGGGGGCACGSTLINAGGASTSDFLADTDFSGGSTSSSTATIDTSGLSSPIPSQAVLRSARYGEFTYTIPYLSALSRNTVTLYFAETSLTAAGQRTFDVAINDNTVLSAFDIFKAGGGANKAVARIFNAQSSSDGKITIRFTSGGGSGNPMVCGIGVASGIYWPTTLPAPTNLEGQSNGQSVTLSWSAVTDAESYVIERDSKQIGTSSSAPYTDSTVTSGNTYSYRVRARNPKATSDPSSAVSIAVLPSSGP